MKALWLKYHVFIIGLISSVCLALTEFTATPKIDWLVVGYAVFVAIGSYFAKNLRGQGATIAGILLTSGASIYSVLKGGGELNISQILLSVAVNIGLALASPAKTVEYEQSATIQQAKQEATAIK